ncbi:hypothetical protein DPMN_096813 [Dreissena polymorpha]|uniref:Uncharacterized protein n=1 Tax=Dreissena polymorpha TaxID=45954 RepID=A0A9D4LA32_DREPO|nr:hypothetical protein DPMN_096813 [Dreissena polymorpha]
MAEKFSLNNDTLVPKPSGTPEAIRISVNADENKNNNTGQVSNVGFRIEVEELLRRAKMALDCSSETNPKTSPEQSGKLPHPPGGHFHDDWANNVSSRVHVILLTRTIFKLNSCINETNILLKFHENWAKNVTSRVFTCFHYIHIEKNARPTGSNVFSPIWTIFELVRDINKTMKTAPPTGGHVFQRTGTTFELNQISLIQTF